MRVHKSAGNFRPAVVRNFKSVVADKCRAETLRLVEFVSVNFGLRVIVRNVARPTTGAVDNFAVDLIRERSIAVIKNRADGALCRCVPKSLTENIALNIFRTIEHGRKVAVVHSFLD